MTTITKAHLKNLIRDELHTSTIGTNKHGHIVCRWSFFYTNGMSAVKYGDKVRAFLESNDIYYEIIELREIWKPFKGGASVAAQSHFRVEFKILDNPIKN